jgi:hypothetical protein
MERNDPRSGHRRREAARGALFQIALVAVAAVFYFLVRGLTQGDEDSAIAHAHSILRLERALRLDLELGVQTHVVPHHNVVTIANWIYMWGHWPAISAALLALYIRDRKHYVLLRNAMFLSGAAGLLVFALWPVAPPRLLPNAGYVDTVTVWSDSYRVLQPPALVNKFAAMPSFHVGWNLLVGITLWMSFRSRWIRALAVASPVLMAGAVVATANHYLLDSIAGMAGALAGLALSYQIFELTYRRGLDLTRLHLVTSSGPPLAEKPADSNVEEAEAS